MSRFGPRAPKTSTRLSRFAKRHLTGAIIFSMCGMIGSSIQMEKWKDSKQGLTGRGLTPNRDWQWTELTHVTIRRSLDSGEVRVAPRGFAILREIKQGDWNIFSLHALVGDEKMMCTLASAVRTEASYRGFLQVDARVADDETLSAALERAGYRREVGIWIYEQALG